MSLSKLTGGILVIKNLDKMSTQMRHSAEKALDGFAEEVLAESKEECPWKTGTLRRSGRPELKTDRSNYFYRLIYDVDYAVEVHENLYANHPRGGKAKFLEDPINRAAPKMLEKLKEDIKKDFE